MAADDDLADLPDDLDIPLGAGGPVFEAPWQARAFGAVVALHRTREDFDWSTFQKALIDEVQAERPGVDPDRLEETYYDQWLRAAERLLVNRGVIDEDEFERRATAFAAGDRNAQEFIEGEHQDAHDGPGHAHDHPH